MTSTDDGHDVLAADKLDEPAVVGDEPSRAVSKRKPRRRRPWLLVGITIVFALIGVGVAANGLRESDSVDDRSAYSPTAGDPARVRPSPRLLLLQNTPPTAADVANASAAIDALPYDGMVVYSAASSLVMRSRPLDVDALIAELSVLTPGLLSNVTHNFLLVYATPAGPFREYGRTVAANFGLFARAARGAGFAGVFFDVEEYDGPSWTGEVACPRADLVTCRAEARAAGLAVMRSMVAEWPEIRVLVTYGPWLSEPLTARALNPPSIIDGSKANPMYGSFAIGLAEGTIGTKASFIDGGEVYTQATSVDVERTIAWITTGMSEQSSLVPTELRASYRTLVSPSMGIYDFPAPYRGKGPSSPAMWENDIAITLAGVQDFAWVYAERFNWAFSSRDKTRPPPPTEWVEATARGRRTGRER